MTKHVVPRAHMARIVRDLQDASKDYFIPRNDAHRLYTEGKIALLVDESIKSDEDCYLQKCNAKI